MAELIRQTRYPITVERIDGRAFALMDGLVAVAALGRAGYVTDFLYDNMHGAPKNLTFYPLDDARRDRQVTSNLRDAGFRKVRAQRGEI